VRCLRNPFDPDFPFPKNSHTTPTPSATPTENRALGKPVAAGSDNRQGDGYIGAAGMAPVTAKVLEGGRTAKVHKGRREFSEDGHFSHLNIWFWGGEDEHKGNRSEIIIIKNGDLIIHGWLNFWRIGFPRRMFVNVCD
jgi:hypothetical protein